MTHVERPRTPPVESLCILRKDSREVTCVLRSIGEDGWSCELLRDGLMYAALRLALYDEAVAYGEGAKSDLEDEGWHA